jgi:predicted NUDIX family phosphoesterase
MIYDAKEKLLVVPAARVNDLCKQGFTSDVHPDILSKLVEMAIFMDRPAAEHNPEYRQIIPYVLVLHKGKYLTVIRQATQTETRLHNRVSLGIGGHINPIDGDPANVLDAGLRRELSEELATDNPPGLIDLKLVGLICDNADEVSRVHLGVVMRWEPVEPILIRETDKMNGSYLTLYEIRSHYDSLENWSRLVYDHLVTHF